MSIKGALNPNINDVAKRLDPDGKISTIVELFNQTNGMLIDMSMIEGNEMTSHRTTQRTGLPTSTWRKLNQGVPQSKSSTQQITDSIGMLEAYANVDKDLAMLNGNTPEFRLSEDMAHIEGLNQEMSETIIYGDTSIDKEKLMGLAPRFDTPSATINTSGYQLINGGGASSTNTSVWLVVWGPNTVFSVYPKGSVAGLITEDLGQKTLLDSDGNGYEGYSTHYQWKNGLVVKDYRYVVRICNVDVALLLKDASGTSADLVDLMTIALERVQNLTMGRPVFYCNRTITSMLRRQIKNSNNVLVSMEEVAGKKVLHFDGVPVRRVDQILNTEATIAGTFAPQ